MIKLDVAHLFVEKYTKDYLLVDFVEEREFIYFRIAEIISILCA